MQCNTIEDIYLNGIFILKVDCGINDAIIKIISNCFMFLKHLKVLNVNCKLSITKTIV